MTIQKRNVKFIQFISPRDALKREGGLKDYQRVLSKTASIKQISELFLSAINCDYILEFGKVSLYLSYSKQTVSQIYGGLLWRSGKEYITTEGTMTKLLGTIGSRGIWFNAALGSEGTYVAAMDEHYIVDSGSSFSLSAIEAQTSFNNSLRAQA